MMDGFEKCRIYGLDAIEEAKTNYTVWHEFSNVIEILNVPFEKRLTDHMSTLSKTLISLWLNHHYNYIKRTNP